MTRRTTVIAGSLVAGLCLAVPLGVSQASASNARHAATAKASKPARASKTPKAPKTPKTPVATPSATPSVTSSTTPSVTPSTTPSVTPSTTPAVTQSSAPSVPVTVAQAEALAKQIIQDNLKPEAVVASLAAGHQSDAAGQVTEVSAGVEADYQGQGPSSADISIHHGTAQEIAELATNCTVDNKCGSVAYGTGTLYSTVLGAALGYDYEYVRGDGYIISLSQVNKNPMEPMWGWFPIDRSQDDAILSDTRWDQIATVIPSA